jgi:phosphatidylinositol-3-phosphatase
MPAPAPHAPRAPHAVRQTLARARARRSMLLLGVVLALVPCVGAGSAQAVYKPPRIKHVWVIVLENEGYAASFGDPSADPYLAQTLPSQGALLENYFATGHVSADNYISMISGQPPNPENQADCPTFSNFTGGSMMANGVESGIGCVYPAEVPSIGSQLTARNLKWKAYQEDMGNNPAREAAACGHPAVGAVDETQKAQAGDGYATRHNPFVYFHAIIDDQAGCNKHVVALGSPSGAMPPSAPKSEHGLATDLTSITKTPRYSFITPNLCNDGHDFPCTNQSGGESALADIDAFLQTWIPKITASQAYRENGLIEITFDEAANSETEACCEEMPGPSSPFPGITGPGGGRVGAILLSRFIRPGTVSTVPYNHYSSLATWEGLLGVPRLAYAATVPTTFGADVFTAP